MGLTFQLVSLVWRLSASVREGSKLVRYTPGHSGEFVPENLSRVRETLSNISWKLAEAFHFPIHRGGTQLNTDWPPEFSSLVTHQFETYHWLIIRSVPVYELVAVIPPS